MNILPDNRTPQGLILEKMGFVPRMVMTPELKTVVDEVLRQWQMSDRFEPLRQYGIRPLDRLLFYGPPGNGKTMACRWMARRLDVPMYRVACDQVHGMYLGQTSSNLAAVMAHLQNLKEPALCLFDEVEHIFVNRRDASGACGHEIGSALTVFMQALDRWEAPTLIVMATNIVERMDDALLSRIDLKLEFVGPTKEQAGQMVEYWKELLCDHGGGEWGPQILERMKGCNPPGSFRNLQQVINHAARSYVVEHGNGDG